jgi:thymidine kinase
MSIIELIIGPMYSGKSSELIRKIKRYTYSKKKCILIKYSGDTRYTNENMVATHDNIFYKAEPALNLSKENIPKYSDYDVIGVDEGQFFPDLAEFAEGMANAGKIVIIACLNGDYLRNGFDTVLKLIPLAEHITKLSAVCLSCSGDASFTSRKSSEKEIEVIGGIDKYAALCRTCYNNKNKCSTPIESGVNFHDCR